MKYFIVVFALFLSMFVLNAQSIKETKVPEKVKTAFAGFYPDAQEIKWQKDKQGFVVNFKLENIPASLLLNPEGKLLETKTSVPQSELPQNLQDYITANCKDYKLLNQEKIVNFDGTVIFKISIIKKKLKKDLLFSNDGHLITNNQ